MSDFDYGSYANLATTAFTLKADAPFISGTVLLALGIIGSFFVYLSLIFRRGRGFGGARWYCFFLVTCNLLYLVAVISNYQSFPFTNMMIDAIRKNFANYKPAVIEWFNICYCWLTSFLFFETIIRSRLNHGGFPHVVWFLYGIVVTVLPGVYMGLKYSLWKYQVWDPEPYSIFHLVGFLLMLLTSIAMVVSAIFLVCCHKNITSNSGPFSIAAFIGIFIYGLVTVWWQIPTGYEIGRTLMASRVDYATMVQIVSSMNQLVSVFNTTKDYAMLSLSTVITWLMLIFMPGVSLFGIGNKKVTSSRIGDSGEKVLTAA